MFEPRRGCQLPGLFAVVILFESPYKRFVPNHTNNSWVEVDVGILADNIREIRSALRPETEIMFIVKDRAYGHGLGPVVRASAAAGVTWFGVAHAYEAAEVREAAPKAGVLVLGGADAPDVESMLKLRVTPVIVDEDHGRRLAAAAEAAGGRLECHLKVDTGMGRLGVPCDQAVAVFERLRELRGLDIRGLCTHFASVEVRKPSLGATQMERFQHVEARIRDLAGRRLFRHVSSSRAILYQDAWDLDAVRPGILLYGYGTGEPRMRFNTRPILQWKTRVIQVKDVPQGQPIGYYSTYATPRPTRIATLAVGYADGYPRALSNKGFVLIRGKRCPVVGRVSMNWITADIGPDGEAAAGDEAVLIGRQGEGEIWANELAKLARTIAYELLTNINPLAERRYVNG